MYPKGTYEQYPNVVNTRNEIISDSAHDYMECSNKGLCDRSSGVCNCFDGYDGSACQRASCPSSSAGFCSGHGMCYTAKEIARKDYNNSYNLWDEYSSMGCICDPGYSGSDCSEQMCKFGADPLYYDDERNVRYSNFTFALYTIDKTDTTKDATTLSTTGSLRSDSWEGNFSIVFYDIYGKPWWSPPIDVLGNCDDITNSLEALPNNVIPKGSVRCSMDFATEGGYVHESLRSSGSSAVAGKPVVGVADGYPINLDAAYGTAPAPDASGYFPFTGVKFTLAFPANPGKLRQPYIDLNLDGTRPTVFAKYVKDASAADANVIRQWVYPNGYSGENFDFVPDLCQGVKLTLKSGASVGTGVTSPTGWGSFGGLTSDEVILLKKCLGDADGDPTNNNQNKLHGTQDALYNWDYGFEDASLASSGSFVYAANKLKNPHLVKLVDTSTSSETRLCDVTSHTFTGVNQINQVGFCNNPDTPGFYVVVYFDPSASVFSYLSNPYDDFSTTTEFLVFTTTGYLTLSSSNTDIFTVFLDAALTASISASIAKIYLGSMYTNVVYSYYPTLPSGAAGEVANVDCESARSSVAACIEKGDYVMIFQTSASNSATTSVNPRYMNLYQVMKISRENREAVRAISYSSAPQINQEVLRYQIVLDMGLNARYPKLGSGTSSTARIYKFTPPAVSVDYVDQCSMRGICDTTNGLCKCFSGYTGDNCAVMNALAV